MRVLIDFDPGAVPGEREAVEEGSFPFTVHGCVMDLVESGVNCLTITVTGPADRVLPLLRRAGYEEEHWTVLEDR